MRVLAPGLPLKAVARILGISVATLRRRLRDARRGIGRFPLPIGEPGQKLIWNHEAVQDYMSATPPPQAGVPKVESPARRRRRHQDAMQVLQEEFGIKVK